jgi:hypothetical protein
MTLPQFFCTDSNAARFAGITEAQIKSQIPDVISEGDPGNNITLATLRDRTIV